ncbi:MAG: Secretion system C-terminal sorting domain, partial [Bacteroidota bacterium]
GWSAEVNGDHSRILINATLWLASNTLREGSLSSSRDVSVWPNPFSGNIRVEYASAVETTLSLNVIEIAGKTVYSSSADLVIGPNLFDLSLEKLHPGFYFLVLNDGRRQEVIRLVKE